MPLFPLPVCPHTLTVVPAAAQEAEEVLQASRAECMRLNQQLLTLQGIQHEYQVSLETMRASSSWRLTAPLRRLLNLVRGH